MIISVILIGTCSSTGSGGSGSIDPNDDSVTGGSGLSRGEDPSPQNAPGTPPPNDGSNSGRGASQSHTSLWNIPKPTSLKTRSENGKIVYLISTWRDLEFLSNSGKFGTSEAPNDGHYELTGDINFPLPLENTEEVEPDSGLKDDLNAESADDSQVKKNEEELNFLPIGSLPKKISFKGIFDGKGHAINNLVINRPEQDEVGLFRSISGATLKNVRLDNVKITGRNQVGGLAGGASNHKGSTTIEKSYVRGEILGANEVGGFVGYISGSNRLEITASSVGAEVSSKKGQHVGGFVGDMKILSNLYIKTSYMNGTVSGDNRVGGLVGNMNINTGIFSTFSYVSGTVSGSTSSGAVGILIGYVNTDAWGVGFPPQIVFGEKNGETVSGKVFFKRIGGSYYLPGIGSPKQGTPENTKALGLVDINKDKSKAFDDLTEVSNTEPYFVGNSGSWPILSWE